MANKCLQRCLRFGVSFLVSSGTHASATPPAARKQACCTAQNLLKLQSSGHTSHASFSSPTFSYSSADEDDVSDNGDLVDDQTLVACSGSRYRFQSRKQPVRASLKALPHPVKAGPSFHNGLNLTESCKCGKLRECGADVAISGSKLHTRSWSSPSLLHMPRPTLRLPRRARSAPASPDQEDYSNGRCAPKGHVAVYVETTQEQQVVPIAYLSHPRFQGLLERAQEEYGFRQQGPGLRIPCSLSELHLTLHHIRASLLQREDTR